MKRLFVLVFNLIVYPLSGLVPRSPRQWVFGHARDTFGGNPKYLFLWMALHRPDIRVTWLTGSAATLRLLRANGYRAHRRWSLGGVVAALRAKVFVFAHGIANVNVQLSRGAFQLNLWHGVGIKAVGTRRARVAAGQAVGERHGLARLAKRLSGFVARWHNLGDLSLPDVLVTTSDFMQAHFAKLLRLPAERCPQLGYSRLDCASDPALAQTAANIDRQAGFTLNPGGFAEIYIYMPTFRDTQRPFFAEALPDPARLSAILAARNALLYVKPHPRTAPNLKTTRDNIRLWPDAIDFHPYLDRFAGLITDYSSVLYDYLFLQTVGAILYTFDFAEYVREDRALIYPFDHNVAGLRVATFDALCDALRGGLALAPAANLGPVRERFWGGSASPASPAIVDFVERRMAGTA